MIFPANIDNRREDIFGYHLHPRIPQPHPRSRIADIGTRTGIWLTDMSTGLPDSVQLDGLDISLEDVSPEARMQPNVTFRQWDIRQAVPDDLVGQYDIVHIHFFTFELRKREIPHILENLWNLLTPRGCLQWDEVDISSLRIARAQPLTKVNAWARLMVLSRVFETPNLAPKMTRLLESVELFDVVREAKDAPTHIVFAMHERKLLLKEMIARTMVIMGEAITSVLEELVPEVLEEIRNGARLDFTRVTVVSKKAEDL
ncbi:hypothetical protein O1611_g6602 [Lasiodiplodia mahajangana]|uniref:Uncharacterized protein n=1 Tax=Lasiodiplodia mahajangana TaxID=1108764 RepID=A0ACC2JHU3_9PEZI|nr:hypothetical protein O1611_g6602 [Lasiodiplodia mahajangana]